MGTHVGPAFLNSCLKTPILPCNNCPAPIYNRPKMFLGRLSTATPFSAGELKSKTKKTTEVVGESDGIRSLAKLYNSIPDYCEINHLTEEEFYSTLDSLRSTCRELKLKPTNLSSLNESCNSSTVSSVKKTATKTKKSSKKKSNNRKEGSNKKKSKESKRFAGDGYKLIPPCIARTPCEIPTEIGSLSSSKEDFRQEVEDFKQTLKDYENIFKSRTLSSTFKRTKSSNSVMKLEPVESPKEKADENTQTDFESFNFKMDPKIGRSSKKSLRKAYSFNDLLETLNENPKDGNSAQEVTHKTNSNPLMEDLTKVERLAHKDPYKMSNYYFRPQGSKCPADELPKITVQSPSCDVGSSIETTERLSGQSKNSKFGKQKPIKVPFSFFNLEPSPRKKQNVETPTPAYPVARPNLAATLRVENVKKKLQEFHNSCTYFDPSLPQFDWEVRKTPAWRSLYLNESHEEILALRLATRKAEQALQRREYELNMELMRQRVKSAPLLLEGTTLWGPSVGKSSHNCQYGAVGHSCENKKRKQRKKFTKDSASCDSRLDSQSKRHDPRKVYTITIKALPPENNPQEDFFNFKGQSRGKSKRKAKNNEETTSTPLPIITQRSSHESGDDLCSVDRAFL